MRDGLKIRGDITFTVRQTDGTEKQFVHRNRVVDGGIDLLIDRFLNGDTTFSAIDSISIGTDTTPSSRTDIALVSPLSNVALSQAPIVNGSTVEFQANFAPGVATGNITEAALYSGATMFSRSVFPMIPKDPTAELVVGWVISFSTV